MASQRNFFIFAWGDPLVGRPQVGSSCRWCVFDFDAHICTCPLHRGLLNGLFLLRGLLNGLHLRGLPGERTKLYFFQYSCIRVLGRILALDDASKTTTVISDGACLQLLLLEKGPRVSISYENTFFLQISRLFCELNPDWLLAGLSSREGFVES